VNFVEFTDSGLDLSCGWVNHIEDCRFSSNHSAIRASHSANNLDIIDCIIEGQSGPGIVVNDGAQILIEGNVIEGNCEYSNGCPSHLSMWSLTQPLLPTDGPGIITYAQGYH